MSRPSLLVIAGTRPELLKLAPLVRELQRADAPLAVQTCFSGQHREILESIVGDLGIVPDYDLREPLAHQTLTQSLSWLLERLEAVVRDAKPAGIIVQGDTSTTLAGALVGFHNMIPVFHVEAGLRTTDALLPYPEETNRRLVTRLAELHFAPTEAAREELLREGVPAESVVVTGNTGIDALRIYADHEHSGAREVLGGLRSSSRLLLVTLHRRENATNVSQVARAVRYLAMRDPDLEVLWLLHVNGIRDRVRSELEHISQVKLLEPQSYRAFVHLMRAATLILTDSGGVQEEAPVLGTPVLVLREQTERGEAVACGSARLVGCDSQNIVRWTCRILEDSALYEHMSQPRYPFGDGRASEGIVRRLAEYYGGARSARRRAKRPSMSGS